jgi:anti-sigma factor RsiW
MIRLLNRDLACQQAVELMTDYLEGGLARGARRRLERHLRDCPHCSAYLAQLRLTIASIGRVEPETLDDETRDGLLELFHRFQTDPDDPGPPEEE